MTNKDPLQDYYEKLERISNLKDKGLISDEEYYNEQQKLEKSKPKPTSKGAWVVVIIIFIIGTIISVNIISNAHQNDIQRNKQKAAQQEQEAAQKEADRQSTIDRLAPEYCNTHQNKRSTFEDPNFPSNDGSGWTPEECIRIIEILYDNYNQSVSQIEAVVASKIQIGMSNVAVWYSWGNANDINKSNYGGKLIEQYVYGTKYIYIEDGKVTSYQDW